MRFNRDDNFDLYSEDDQARLADMYQRIFNTTEGRTVLVHILSSLRFFRELDTDEDRILHNAALRIFRYSGVFVEGKSGEIIDAALAREPKTFFQRLLNIGRRKTV